jgi:hypothetical protein
MPKRASRASNVLDASLGAAPVVWSAATWWPSATMDYKPNSRSISVTSVWRDGSVGTEAVAGLDVVQDVQC